MRILIAAALAASTIAIPAQAGQILGAVGGVINSGGPGFGSINDTFNQAGLLAGYTSGVTDFASYLASNPTHTTTFNGFEWFSAQGTNSASVTYDLGSALGIKSLALWNEESSGIGSLALFGSLDGVTFSSLGAFNPIDNPVGVDYGAEVFSFAATQARYIRFDMTGCPQQPSTFSACAIGEVAFESAVIGAVPEPATWAMMISGFGMIGGAMRRRRVLGLSLA